MKTVILIGAKGFVGSCIAVELQEYNVISVCREDPLQSLITKGDIVIHCANSGKRYYGNHHPEFDYKESVEKTQQILDWCNPSQKFILISSVSARIESDTVYGQNRLKCEQLVSNHINTKNNYLIVRLNAMYSDTKSSGPLYDLINDNTVYIGSSSEVSFMPLSYVGHKIAQMLDETGNIELSGRGYVTLQYIKDEIGSKTTFLGEPQHSKGIVDIEEAPLTTDAIEWCKSQKDCS